MESNWSLRELVRRPVQHMLAVEALIRIEVSFKLLLDRGFWLFHLDLVVLFVFLLLCQLVQVCFLVIKDYFELFHYTFEQRGGLGLKRCQFLS